MSGSAAYNRPPLVERSFVSLAIDQVVTNVSVQIADPLLRELWVDCFPNTLDTTVNFSSTPLPQGRTFVVTGDIDAMWLRDSTWQINGYIPYAKQDAHLLQMLKGVVDRQLYSVLLDPYANAYNFDNNSQGHQSDIRTPPMSPGLFEGKFEVDSLACVLHTTNALFEQTGDVGLLSATWLAVVERIYSVFRYQQASTEHMSPADPLYYSFARKTTVPTDTLLHQVGPPGVRTGMIKSPFRPSDDATRLPFFVPANAFAVVELRRTAAILRQHVADQQDLAGRLASLADEIDAAIQRHGVVADPDDPSQLIYAFEVDGFGGRYLMDDANVPSLLALPFLGYVDAADPVYQNTRRRILGPRNPYWSKGLSGRGIGSPHTGQGWIWPMSVIFQIMTSDDPQEIADCLDILKRSSAGTGFMHESFYKDDPRRYTRSWFAMCNSLFGSMILQVLDRYPTLLTGVV